MSQRRTIIVAGGTAAASMRLRAAREGWHGVGICTIEQVASRLAGGFLQPVEGDALAGAVKRAIHDTPAAELGDLGAIADLPGFPASLAATLSKLWHACVDLTKRADDHPDVLRLRTLARLEERVLRHLPPGMLRPADLVSRALATIVRLNGPEAILGEVELAPLLDVAPCWRLLLLALHRPGKLHWHAGPYAVPGWWELTCGDKVDHPVVTPGRRTVTCATPRHEVIEAMRWARSLLAEGVDAQHIAFAAAAPAEYDNLVFAMAEEASLPIHFGHGRRALLTRDGQAAAALADLLLHGLSQDRVRRLAGLARVDGTSFGRLPPAREWGLPRAAPLGSPKRWRQALTDDAVAATLLPVIDLLAAGTAAATEAGETVLRGSARLLWRRALARTPASALEATLGGLRLPDTGDPACSVGWMYASALATCPRAHVWLFGLNARTWPRASREDPLLPDLVIPSTELDPLTVTHVDRLAFEAIAGTTERELVCSASRRDATGRLLGLSPLLPAGTEPERLRRARVPAHAMSEQDRMMARPAEFAGTLRARSAEGCWQDWHDPGVTRHDGWVRPGHPVLAAALGRIHSASSLQMLLRNPLGFTWKYALCWKGPDSAVDAMDLNPCMDGSCVARAL